MQLQKLQAAQQRPQAASMLKRLSSNTSIFDGKNGKFEIFEDLFHTMLKMQPEMTEAKKKLTIPMDTYAKKQFKHSKM